MREESKQQAGLFGDIMKYRKLSTRFKAFLAILILTGVHIHALVNYPYYAASLITVWVLWGVGYQIERKLRNYQFINPEDWYKDNDIYELQ